MRRSWTTTGRCLGVVYRTRRRYIPFNSITSPRPASTMGSKAVSLPSLEAEAKPKPKPLINLLRGWPSPAVLPVSLLRQAADEVFSDERVYVPALQYGPDPGYQPLREALATWLGSVYRVAAAGRAADEICVTGGASQNMACVLASFTDPAWTRGVWAVMPCYYLACPIFGDAGFAGPERLRGVPEDEEGVDIGWLEGRLRECDEREGEGDRPAYKTPGPHRKLYRHIIYVVPTCANPSGKTMTLARRQALVRLARRHDALIISDDVYDLLQWPTTPSPSPFSPLLPPLPRLSDIDLSLGRSEFDPPDKHFGHAISNGSFSKLVGPGVRTGWTHASPDFVTGLSQNGATRSGGAPSQLCAAMVTRLLASGQLDEHLANVTRPALRDRHALMLRCIRRELGPLGVRVREEGEAGSNVAGGYFVWLTLPEGGPTAGEVAERAREVENLVIAPGGLFVVGDAVIGEGEQFGMNMRLCFSWEGVEEVEEGVVRLGRVLGGLMGEGGQKKGGG
ncbi:pyridoxal phosphate-dependent transferase, partial [Echria macrotheca]